MANRPNCDFSEITFREKRSDSGKHELKTIYVDTIATFLRFSFGANFRTPINARNQIGVVALKVFGEPASLDDASLRLSTAASSTLTLASSSLWRAVGSEDGDGDGGSSIL